MKRYVFIIALAAIFFAGREVIAQQQPQPVALRDAERIFTEGSKDERMEAVRSVRGRSGVNIDRILFLGIQDPDNDVGSLTVSIISEQGGGATQILVRARQSKEEFVHRRIASALGTLGFAGAGVLEECIRIPNPKIRDIYIEHIKNTRPAGGLALLLPLLGNPTSSGQAAIDAVITYETSAVRPLTEICLASRGLICEHSAAALSLLGDPGEAALRSLLSSTSGDALLQALTYLDVAPKDHLLANKTHVDERVRAIVATRLREYAGTDVVSAIVSLFGDRSAKVRANAVRSLIELRVQSNYPELVRMLYDSDAKVRSEVINAIETVYPDAIIDMPQNARTFNQLGLCYFDAERFEDANEYFEKALAERRTEPEYHYNLARVNVEFGNTQVALGHIDEALGQNPRHDPSLLLKSEILASSGRAAESRQAVSNALAASPTNKEAAMRYARILSGEGNHTEAAMVLRRQTLIATHFSPVFGQLAEVYCKLEKYDEAEQLLLRFQKAHQTDAQVCKYLADIYATYLNSPAEAQRWYNLYLELGGDPEEVAWSYASVQAMLSGDIEEQLETVTRLVETGNVDEANVLLQRSANANPQDRAAALLLARTHFEKGEFDQAKEILARLLAEDENVAEAHYYLGIIADDRAHDFDSALYHYTKYLQLGGSNPQIYSRLEILLDKADTLRKYRTAGIRCFDAGLYEFALEMFVKAATGEPSDATTHYNLGSTYYKLGDGENAILELELALYYDSGLRNAHAVLAHVRAELMNDPQEALLHLYAFYDLGGDRRRQAAFELQVRRMLLQNTYDEALTDAVERSETAGFTDAVEFLERFPDGRSVGRLYNIVEDTSIRTRTTANGLIVERESANSLIRECARRQVVLPFTEDASIFTFEWASARDLADWHTSERRRQALQIVFGSLESVQRVRVATILQGILVRRVFVHVALDRQQDGDTALDCRTMRTLVSYAYPHLEPGDVFIFDMRGVPLNVKEDENIEEPEEFVPEIEPEPVQVPQPTPQPTPEPVAPTPRIEETPTPQIVSPPAQPERQTQQATPEGHVLMLEIRHPSERERLTEALTENGVENEVVDGRYLYVKEEKAEEALRVLGESGAVDFDRRDNPRVIVRYMQEQDENPETSEAQREGMFGNLVRSENQVAEVSVESGEGLTIDVTLEPGNSGLSPAAARRIFNFAGLQYPDVDPDQMVIRDNLGSEYRVDQLGLRRLSRETRNRLERLETSVRNHPDVFDISVDIVDGNKLSIVIEPMEAQLTESGLNEVYASCTRFFPSVSRANIIIVDVHGRDLSQK
ncbi:MAG: tetratricopeptide repeat protein [Planctomycetes bacterium]|nr:tetratricopeptide repeat protein [Planctomycetota bacterium]